jgi:hypothetical protein
MGRKKSKDNNTVIAAVIGGAAVIIGTVITVFGPRLVNSTPTPILPTTAPISEIPGCKELSSMDLSDSPMTFDFENEDASGFSRDTERWTVVGDGKKNSVFQANTANLAQSTDARFGDNFSNGCIEFRFQLINYDLSKDKGSGNIEFHFRMTKREDAPDPAQFVGEDYVVDFVQSDSNAQLAYTNQKDDWEPLNKGSSDHLIIPKNEWQYVVVDVQDDTVKVYLNGKRIISSQDSKLLKVEKGGFALGITAYTTVYFDDIKIRVPKP